jgi:hypothetical protein
MDEHRPPNINKQLEFCQIKNLKLLTGGGTIDNNQEFLREGLILLNNNSNIEHLFIKPFSKYIYEQLKFNVIILEPITCLINDSDESEGTYK